MVKRKKTTKNNIFTIMTYIVFFIVVCVFFLKLMTTINITKNANNPNAQTTVKLSCDNFYSIVARYHTPDQKGIMSKLTVTVTKNETSHIYDMKPAMSASGSKFETRDKKYSLWEHQGTFTFSNNDTTLATCIEDSH